MSTAVSQQIFLFRTQIENRRFDEGIFRVLESVLASIDLKSLDRVVYTLKQFMRHESLCIIEEIAGKSTEYKLLIVDFLVHVFNLIGDTESCLALIYEALLMREQKAISDQRLLVSYSEWLTFAEHSLESDFCSIANKACEKALLCFEMNIVDDPANDFVIEKIKKLKDVAVTSASSKSVQAQTAEYFKNKSILENSQGSYISVEAKSSGSTLFKDGIKRRHRRQLDEYRHLKLDGITGDVPNTLVGLSANSIPSPAL
ncbi:protein DOUBLE-STRAND BREAK FORMATION isoform X1 [Lycium barbarum]|uniref:protein DOUBLE-STRAND BREAK FORMATION isoform X1 n=1 Tax=Lycium barbarum TaxID=112863 RepID=UPI00293EE04D|nr:protein DOUBLE-STRAND BREAK FORMATION isoform X1 [Lycium barbarum]